MNEQAISEINEMIPRLRSQEQTHVREVYYLNNWYRYKKNLKIMGSSELKNARMLFRALKELTQENREFLAMKYDRPKRPTDAYLAEELGMSKDRYVEKRRMIQRELKSIMISQKLKESNGASKWRKK